MINKKRCQIYASLPITCFEVPIIGQTELNLTEAEIYKCLCAKAEVIEILPDGKRMNLDFTNYNKDNSVKPIKTLIIDETPEQSPTIVEETKEEEIVVVIEDKVEIEDEIEEVTKTEEVEETETVEDTIKETEEVINDEVKEEQTVAETVKSYQVASRNNNYNNKKSKNKK